ncbi:cysteine proteinase [Trifolium pratense]|uniref:Cysteine proteinase n=1 Tax=Trifolium pratense TaxID=57577 RepID=A0A2K3L159_TRIPR|nr:cysteine proteinase [Trifolium pratense]
MIKRREIFKKNLLYIQKFNSQGNNTYRLAINKFADMNNEDMSVCEQEEPSGLLASEKIVSFNISEEDVPNSFDWREHNAVSPVRDQGTCAQKAFRYVSQEGIATEDDFPYEGVKQSCDPIEDVDKLYIDGYTTLGTDEWSLRTAVSRQPVAASIRISEDFRYYDNGIYQGACGNQGHAVLIVGYGGEIDEEKYWIVMRLVEL